MEDSNYTVVIEHRAMPQLTMQVMIFIPGSAPDIIDYARQTIAVAMPEWQATDDVYQSRGW